MEETKLNVSIVIPMFNSSKTIENALNSILNQTFQYDVEVLIINDGSIDDSKILVENYIQNNQSNKIIRLLSQKNSGPAKARNLGIKEAKGKYIAFLDADDMWHPQKLEIILLVMEKYNLNIIGHSFSLKTNFDKIFDIGISQQSLVKKSFWDLILKNFAVTPSMVVTREKCLLFDETMRYTEDHELWLRMSFYNEIYFLDESLVALGRRPLSSGGLSANKIAMRLGEMKMYFKLFKLNKAFIVIIPFLLIFSSMKHISRMFMKS